MLRMITLLTAVIGLAGCEIASSEPLLEAEAARAIAPDYAQRIDAVDVEGEFIDFSAYQDGRSVLVESYETSVSGTIAMVEQSFLLRFHPLPDRPRFFIAELRLDPETTEEENWQRRGYGLVTCDPGDTLVLLDMDIPQDQRSSPTDDRSFDEWGTLTVSSASVLFDVLENVLAGNHYMPLDADDFDSSLSCAALFADPI